MKPSYRDQLENNEVELETGDDDDAFTNIDSLEEIKKQEDSKRAAQAEQEAKLKE